MSYSVKKTVNNNTIILAPQHVFGKCNLCKRRFAIHKDYIEYRLNKLSNSQVLVVPSKCAKCCLEPYRKNAWGEFMVSDLSKPTIKEQVKIKPEWEDSLEYETQKVEYKYSYFIKMKRELLEADH